MTDWDKRFIELAKHIAQWSKDPSTKCGAVIVRPDRTIASSGYNGFPRGVEDLPMLLSNREKKYARMIHAEMNAILNAKEPLDGYTLYQWPGRSCSSCASGVIQAGITTVVSPHIEAHGGQWAESQDTGVEMFNQAGVELRYVDEEVPTERAVKLVKTDQLSGPHLPQSFAVGADYMNTD